MLLGIDQGTSGTTCLALDPDGEVTAQAYRPLESCSTRPGWVEQDPDRVLGTMVEAVAEVLDSLGGPTRVQAAGLANQGESVLAWDAVSGVPLTPVLVWSDARAQSQVDALAARGQGEAIARESGLHLSTYFSAPKLRWLLEHDAAVQAAAQAGTLRLGTLDAWLGVKLGAPSLTDPSTASRTQLYSLTADAWSPFLLEQFGIEAAWLPQIKLGAAYRGTLSHSAWGGALPWYAGLVDQVAALLGCGCLEPGEVKVTYGTGAFVLAQRGPVSERVPGLLCSVGLSGAGSRSFVLDGGVFTAGTAIRWLERMGLLTDTAQASRMATEAGGNVRFLPAFGGLGAPWWQPEAKGVFSGLTESTTPADLVRAVLDGVALAVADITGVMGAALPELRCIRVDGGLSRNDYLLQRQADLTGLRVERARSSEATALGVALLAGVAAGVLTWEGVRTQLYPQETFAPKWSSTRRERERADWTVWSKRAAALP